MIGIYKITNLLTGQFYIGQSVDLERRFKEHKSRKPKRNDILHYDIQKYGKENFKFEVLEICKKEELNAKELQYIKKLNPFYNTTGKPLSTKTKEKISKSCKIWWENLDISIQNKIISNNLKGPPKGHKVSQNTRNKLRQWNIKNSGTRVRIIETGQEFSKIKDLENYVGACTGTCAAYWKGKIKTVKGYHIEKCRD